MAHCFLENILILSLHLLIVHIIHIPILCFSPYVTEIWVRKNFIFMYPIYCRHSSAVEREFRVSMKVVLVHEISVFRQFADSNSPLRT